MATKKRPKNPGAPVKGRRELIVTGSDKRYVRRDKRGRFADSVDVGRSLAKDRKDKAKKKVKPGYGDKGDQPKRTAKKK